MTTYEKIYPILLNAYENHTLCHLMTVRLVEMIEADNWDSRGREKEIMVYVWMNTSGGGTAQRVAEKIEAALNEES
jgi:hypothetical protein